MPLHALEHHVQPLNEAINIAGKCAVPATLVVLGGYFYVPPVVVEGEVMVVEKRKKSRRRRQDSRSFAQLLNKPLPGESKTVILAVATRMIITPLLLVPLMVLATKSDWHAVFKE